MSKENIYYGATMSFEVVSDYYLNPAYPNFGAFVFQQQMDYATTINNDYWLIAYAVDIHGTVLNAGKPLPLITIMTHPFHADKNKVQFANMRLNMAGLYELYPPGGGVDSELTITPTGYYHSTGYIIYTATTIDDKQPLTPRSAPLNPSPPY
jgi:hypothetical protein